MGRLITASMIFSLAMVIGGPVANAAYKPIWDLDYELYYGETVPGFELWYQQPGGSPVLYHVYDKYSDATNTWFFLFEHNAHPSGTIYWINETTQLKWRFVALFEEYSQATTAAAYFQAVGLPTKIRAVFGGYDYSHLISPHRYESNPYYNYIIGK